MKGIFFIPINKPSTPYSEVLNSIIDETIFCDNNSISEAFFGEHMADKYRESFVLAHNYFISCKDNKKNQARYYDL